MLQKGFNKASKNLEALFAGPDKALTKLVEGPEK